LRASAKLCGLLEGRAASTKKGPLSTCAFCIVQHGNNEKCAWTLRNFYSKSSPIHLVVLVLWAVWGSADINLLAASIPADHNNINNEQIFRKYKQIYKANTG
jgi:hypothetical protein